MQHLDEGRLQEWVDRERSGLGVEEVAAIEAHLEACIACARRAEELTALDHETRRLLAQAPSDPMPDFADVRRRAEGPRTVRRELGVLRRSAWAASIVVALGAGWIANEMAREGAGPPPPSVEIAPNGPEAEGGDVAAVQPGGGVEPGEAAQPGEAVESGQAVPPRQAVALETPGAGTAPVPAAGVDAARTVSAPTPSVPTEEEVLAQAPIPSVSDASLPGNRALLPDTVAPAPAEVDVAISATGPRSIRGRVTDASGDPVQAAQVYVEGTGIGALTGVDGSFVLVLDDSEAGVPGEVAVRVELIGYVAERLELQAGGRDADLGDVRLTEQALALDQVVVTGSTERFRSRDAEPVTVGPADWAAGTRAEVEDAAGFRLLIVPDHPLSELGLASFDGVVVSRVVQAVDGARVVLLQSRREIRVADEVVRSEGAVATAVREGLFLAALGSASVDELGAVLARVR